MPLAGQGFSVTTTDSQTIISPNVYISLSFYHNDSQITLMCIECPQGLSIGAPTVQTNL